MNNNLDSKSHTEQSTVSPSPSLSPDMQQQLVMGSVALGTMFCLTVLIREIRLLVQACKS
ncbi:hypothetical protein NDI44_27180 [Trichocoleus sp. DQ-A3]|uniref:hypothetical protein n=1 Tax=Cyanophyceae TaxID=3028117 RepID=UPI0016846CDE|nr:hypothetical protein [Coleofasciculus sp. FACHB-125]MBD1903870.1 hypothetical protein [Coleofasciculus sp. FACHB-125]